MFSDPSDLSLLTPRHFLTGNSLAAAAEPDLQELPSNHLTRSQDNPSAKLLVTLII